MGRIATLPFVQGIRINFANAERGPFRSSRDWLTAQLLVIQLDCKHTLEEIKSHFRNKLVTGAGQSRSDKTKEQDESDTRMEQDDNRPQHQDDTDDDEYLERDTFSTFYLVERLLLLLPNFIPKSDTTSLERSTLFHHDLNLQNNFVDREGKITAILDWENTVCLPAWAACDLPSFLDEQPRQSVPDPKDFDRGLEEEMYKESLMQYQPTKLREKFLTYMKSRRSLWVEIYENSNVERDFLRAVQLCDCGPSKRDISRWLNVFQRNHCSVDQDTYIPIDEVFDPPRRVDCLT